MLRNSYLNKFKDKSQNEFDQKFTDDDLYVLMQNRPLNEKKIKDLPKYSMDKFVHDILTNKKVSNLMYFTNAEKEIELVKKEDRFMKANTIKVNRKSSIVNINSPLDIVRNRDKRETIAKIADEARKEKEDQQIKAHELEEKNKDFEKAVKAIDKKENLKQTRKIIFKRKEKLEKVFNGIKEKLLTEVGNSSGKINEMTLSRYNHTTSDSRNKLVLPSVKLNLEDVYSRLYHNAVLCTKPSKDTKEKEISTKNLKENKAENPNKTNSKLFVKNVLDWTNGKEFTVRVTEDILLRSLYSNSGGPGAKPSKVLCSPNSFNSNKILNLNLLQMRNKDGNSLLHTAVEENVVDIVNYLLSKGVDVNIQNKNGDTALHIAINKENKEMIQLLLNNKAYLNIPNKSNNTSLDLASVKYI